MTRTSKRLRESEERYRLLFEDHPNPILVFAVDTLAIIGVNNKAQALYGYSREEFLKMTINDIRPPEHISTMATFVAEIAGVEEQGICDVSDLLAEPPPEGLKHIKKDGTVIDVEVASCHRMCFEGKIAVLSVITDITERKQADAALRCREEKFRAVSRAVEQSPVTVVITDVSGTIQYVNPKFTEISGYTHEEAVGQNPRILKSGEQPPEFYQELWHTISAGKEWRGEFRNKKKNGEFFWESASISPIVDSVGTVTHFVAIKDDITKRRIMKQRVRESEERFRQLVENIDDVFWLADAELTSIIYISPAYETISGRTCQSLYDCPRAFLDAVHPKDLPGVISAVMNPKGTPYDIEYRVIKPDGRISWVNNRGSAIRNSAGDIYRNGGVVSDITDLKRNSEELRNAKDAAETANLSKSVFLANMSHEIRTPLNAILGFSQVMLRDQEVTDQQRQSLNIINGSGEHLLALINDILEISKIEAGRSALNLSAFNLREVLDDMSRMFHLRATSKHLDFEVVGMEKLPHTVVGDAGKLRQVLINLLGNAIKFTEQGKIAMRTTAREESPEKIRLSVEVEDTGIGISEAEVGLLFQAFSQTASGARTEGGTGLGLAISREFARLMGGDITVQSEAGKGSLFRFEIPLNKRDGAECSLQRLGSRRVMHLHPDCASSRILIVDDAVNNRLLLNRMLRAVGFEVREASNGAEAVKEAHAWQPHLILMDMHMPVMNGDEAVRLLRASKTTEGIKIVSISASAFEQDRQNTLAVGADDFIAKPFREGELFGIIGHLLNVRFEYEEIAGQESKIHLTTDLSRESLASIPTELLAAMRNAILTGNQNQLIREIERVAEQDAALGQYLAALGERYDYEALGELLSSTTVTL